MKSKLKAATAILLRVLHNPQLNLVVNIFLMGFTGFMALGQWSAGNTPIATVLTVSTCSYVTAILFWFLIWKTMPPKRKL